MTTVYASTRLKSTTFPLTLPLWHFGRRAIWRWGFLK